MSATTKIYKNTSKKTVNIVGVGEIEAGSQISVTSEFHTPVNLENFPGVVEVVAQEEAKAEKESE